MISSVLAFGPFVAMLLGQPIARQAAPLTPAPVDQETAQAVSRDELATAIDQLGSFELPVRTQASRTVRRTAPALAVPALNRAAREHPDGYVRYRALVLLAGFGDTSAAEVMREAIADPNDRLRTVAYAWYEHHRDPAIVPVLLEALGREESEFVRPALLRAVAAYSDESGVRAAIIPFIMRGQDFFRGALIDALGDYRAAFAVPSIMEVARLEGPLQDDAVTALGRIGDQSSRSLLAELQRTGPRAVQPGVAAALVLLGSNVEANAEYLTRSLSYGVATGADQGLVRGTAHGLAVLAIRGSTGALTALLDAAVAAGAPARAPIALAVGRVALRNPDVVLDVVEPRSDREAVLELMLEAFDMLSSEDYELERFYVAVRRVYWSSTADSPRRQLAEAFIRKLEF
jgi:HEAT repeat protein